MWAQPAPQQESWSTDPAVIQKALGKITLNMPSKQHNKPA